MTVEASQLKRGAVVNYEGKLMRVVELSLLTPGNWRSMVQMKLKDLKSGSVVQKRFRSNDKLEPAYLDACAMEYLYSTGTEHIFMDMKTLDQIPLSDELLEDAMNYLVPNTQVNVQFYDNNPVSIDLPTTVTLKVVRTDPAIKGQTATNQYKPAELETGLKVNVPPFIGNGDMIKVDTRTGEYLGRA
jgi:elongation factor P